MQCRWDFWTERLHTEILGLKANLHVFTTTLPLFREKFLTSFNLFSYSRKLWHLDQNLPKKIESVNKAFCFDIHNGFKKYSMRFHEINFKQILKVSAFYLEKRKSFIPENCFLSRTAKVDPKDGVNRSNFQWGSCSPALAVPARSSQPDQNDKIKTKLKTSRNFLNRSNQNWRTKKTQQKWKWKFNSSSDISKWLDVTLKF